MAKVTGSYKSVIRGVSEQAPHDRRPGQHTEQINFISDPVRGAARRHGSVMQDEFELAPYRASTFHDILADTQGHRTVTFYVDGVGYDLTIRTRAGSGTLGFAWAFNRSTRKFVPIQLAAGDPVLDQLVTGGMSAAVNIGKYLFIAGNSIVPACTIVEAWDTPANRSHAAVWVRGGAYAREFLAVVVMQDGTRHEAKYKTLTSSYPELLDTTDLDPADENYQALVNARVNAYNSQATQWIGKAAEDITPGNIASKLAAALTASGLTGVSVSNGTVTIEADGVKEITVDDGGDNSLLHGVAQEVLAAELVSATHWAGKIVKVRPKRSNGDDAYYLEAVAKESGATGWTAVSWRETAGTVTTPTSVFALATVKGGKLYMASSAAKLATMAGITDAPGFKPSTVGDQITAPVPAFFGRKIDYLGAFQDRLVVGAGSILMFSKPGDYFNWFRASVLTVADDDPVEQYPLGSEDDVITGSAIFDRSTVYFGERWWYSVNGNQPLTPKSNGVVILREEPQSNLVTPRAADNFVFYCKASSELDTRSTRLYQLQAGLLADSPEGQDISSALNDYLRGDPLEIVALTGPNVIALRTTASRQQLYLYTYLDGDGAQRLFDSWSTWQWSPVTGHLLSISRDGSDLLAYMLREGRNPAGQRKIWVACERFTVTGKPSRRPHLDSLRPATEVGGFLNDMTDFGDTAAVAYDASSPAAYVGARLDQRLSLEHAYGPLSAAWAGIQFTSELTPTNPYVLDSNGEAVINGRLTLVRADVEVANTGGAAVSVTARGTKKQVREFIGRTVGHPSTLARTQPLVTTSVSAAVGGEVRECSYTISAVKWLPLTVTGIQWSGQYFNNARRI